MFSSGKVICKANSILCDTVLGHNILATLFHILSVPFTESRSVSEGRRVRNKSVSFDVQTACKRMFFVRNTSSDNFKYFGAPNICLTIHFQFCEF